MPESKCSLNMINASLECQSIAPMQDLPVFQCGMLKVVGQNFMVAQVLLLPVQAIRTEARKALRVHIGI